MAAKFDFKSLEQAFEVDWPVAVQEPQDGGTVKSSEFMARFRLLSPEETEAAQAEAISGEKDPNAWISAFFVGLGQGEGELTPELRKLLLSRSYVRQALVKAYLQCAQGAPAKN